MCLAPSTSLLLAIPGSPRPGTLHTFLPSCLQAPAASATLRSVWLLGSADHSHLHMLCLHRLDINLIMPARPWGCRQTTPGTLLHPHAHPRWILAHARAQVRGSPQPVRIGVRQENGQGGTWLCVKAPQNLHGPGPDHAATSGRIWELLREMQSVHCLCRAGARVTRSSCSHPDLQTSPASCSLTSWATIRAWDQVFISSNAEKGRGLILSVQRSRLCHGGVTVCRNYPLSWKKWAHFRNPSRDRNGGWRNKALGVGAAVPRREERVFLWRICSYSTLLRI